MQKGWHSPAFTELITKECLFASAYFWCKSTHQLCTLSSHL